MWWLANPRAVRDRLIKGEQDDFCWCQHAAENEDFTREPGDTAGAEVHRRDDLPSDKARWCVVHGELRARLLLAYVPAEINYELDRRLSRLGKRLGVHHRSDSHVDGEKLVRGCHAERYCG